MGKVKLAINFERPQAVYYAGETISGEVIVENEAEIKAKEIRVEVNGHGRVLWTFGKVMYYGSEDYLSSRTVLSKGDGDSLMLQPGHHQYAFQVTLPPQLRSSIEFFEGRVRYQMKLVIDRPWHTDDSLTRMFTVLSHLDLNHVPDALTPIAVEKSKTLGVSSGTISASLSIDRSGFVPGERIPIHLVCANQSDRVMKSTRVSLWQGMTCHAKIGSYRFKRKLVSTQRPETHAGGTDIWKGEGIPIPPCPPTGLPGCKIIDTDYYIMIEVDPSGLSLDLEASVPVIIGTIPPAQVLKNYGFGSPLTPPHNPAYPSLFRHPNPSLFLKRMKKLLPKTTKKASLHHIPSTCWTPHQKRTEIQLVRRGIYSRHNIAQPGCASSSLHQNETCFMFLMLTITY